MVLNVCCRRCAQQPLDVLTSAASATKACSGQGLCSANIVQGTMFVLVYHRLRSLIKWNNLLQFPRQYEASRTTHRCWTIWLDACGTRGPVFEHHTARAHRQSAQTTICSACSCVRLVFSGSWWPRACSEWAHVCRDLLSLMRGASRARLAPPLWGCETCSAWHAFGAG